MSAGCPGPTTRILLGITFTLALLAAPALPAGAGVPGQVNYQGLLLDDVGDPVSGAVDFEFRLFDVASGGTAIWVESHAAVDVLDGVYAVSLGETTALDPALLAVATLYLEVVVDGDVLAPRQRLLAVPYALRAAAAEDAAGVGGVDAEFVRQLFEFGTADGGAPDNDDPSEGLADVDGDGRANFIDPDNDDDGISDVAELAQGSDINLVTPVVANLTPPSADALATTSVAIAGANFDPGTTVSFGSESPVPSSATPTELVVEVGPQAGGFATVQVSHPNGESAEVQFEFRDYGTPLIASVDPNSANGLFMTQVTIAGQNFSPGVSVSFGAESPTPQNLTETSFSVDVGPQAAGTVAVDVVNPGGATGSTSFEFFYVAPEITSLAPYPFPESAAGAVTVTGQGFLPAPVVEFDGSPVTPSAVSDTEIVFTAPARPPGSYEVRVQLASGLDDTRSLLVSDGSPVFLTAATHSSAIGDPDAACGGEVAAAGLQGVWKAWAQNGAGQGPATTFVQSPDRYHLLDGTTIADSWADLTDGSLDAPIDRDATGSAVTTDLLVFTGVGSSGAASGSNCSGWSGSGITRLGDASLTSSDWTDKTSATCSQDRRFYCFMQ